MIMVEADRYGREKRFDDSATDPKESAYRHLVSRWRSRSSTIEPPKCAHSLCRQAQQSQAAGPGSAAQAPLAERSIGPAVAVRFLCIRSPIRPAEAQPRPIRRGESISGSRRIMAFLIASFRIISKSSYGFRPRRRPGPWPCRWQRLCLRSLRRGEPDQSCPPVHNPE